MRYVLDFGSSNGQLAPPAFSWFRDATTRVAIPAPTIYQSPAPAWTYFFDFSFPAAASPSTTSIEYGVTLNGVGLSDVISYSAQATSQASPLSSNGAGGQQTLAQLRTLIRQESDTENDPHISDAELTGWINQSRYRLYDLLIQSFGDDYFVAQAQIPTDGVSTQYPLPNGVLYGGAQPFYKGALVEVISGGGVNPSAPVNLRQFNLAEKNRFSHPFAAALPYAFPRYRLMGSNLVFNRAPPAMTVQVWYAPRLAPLVNDADVADDFSGWLELVVVDCAIKALSKQERDASVAMARKQELIAEVKAAAANRNVGEPNTVVETNGDFMGTGFGWNGFYGGGGF